MNISPSTSAISHVIFTSSQIPTKGASIFDDDVAEIRNLPESDRWLAFTRLIDAANTLDPELRDTRLIAVTGQLKHLPPGQRAAAFDLLSGPSGTLDKARSAPLAKQLPHLNNEKQFIKFDDLTG